MAKTKDKTAVLKNIDFDEWSRYIKLVERDILACLTEREREIWVKYAIVGYSIEEIRDILKEKNIDHRCADKILASAQLKLVAFLLKDDKNLVEIVSKNEHLKKKLIELVRKGGNYVAPHITSRVNF